MGFLGMGWGVGWKEELVVVVVAYGGGGGQYGWATTKPNTIHTGGVWQGCHTRMCVWGGGNSLFVCVSVEGGYEGECGIIFFFYFF